MQFFISISIKHILVATQINQLPVLRRYLLFFLQILDKNTVSLVCVIDIVVKVMLTLLSFIIVSTVVIQISLVIFLIEVTGLSIFSIVRCRCPAHSALNSLSPGMTVGGASETFHIQDFIFFPLTSNRLTQL